MLGRSQSLFHKICSFCRLWLRTFFEDLFILFFYWSFFLGQFFSFGICSSFHRQFCSLLSSFLSSTVCSLFFFLYQQFLLSILSVPSFIICSSFYHLFLLLSFVPSFIICSFCYHLSRFYHLSFFIYLRDRPLLRIIPSFPSTFPVFLFLNFVIFSLLF